MRQQRVPKVKAAKTGLEHGQDMPAGGPEAAKVMELAKTGMMPTEIAAWMGCEPAQIKAMIKIVRQGYAKGTAALKFKTYEDAMQHDGPSRRYLLDMLAHWANGARPRHLQMSQLLQAQVEKARAQSGESQPGNIQVQIIERSPRQDGKLGNGRESEAAFTDAPEFDETRSAGGKPAGTPTAAD